MMRFQNLYYDSFLEKYGKKRIIIYGMGGIFLNFLKLNTEKTELMEAIDFLIDADPEKKNRSMRLGCRTLSVQMPKDYEGKPSMAKEYVMILCLSHQYIPEALKSLDRISAFDDMVCLYGIGCFFWGWEQYQPPHPVFPVLPECPGHYEIPKKIHYCWFGGGEIPEKDRRCIESWQKLCPDYELCRWDETRINIREMPVYVQEAYEAEKYAFVSDYVRLLAVFQSGGFYFDTDVFLLGRFDELRKYRSVYTFMEYGEIATGLGFGSVAHAKELEEMLRLYEQIPFYDENGGMNLTPCPRYTNDYFRRRGVRIDNSLQMTEDMLFLPSSYFCPLMAVPCEDGTNCLALYALEDHSIAIHLCNNSWRSKEDRTAFEKKKEELQMVNDRLLRDWKLQRKGDPA